VVKVGEPGGEVRGANGQMVRRAHAMLVRRVASRRRASGRRCTRRPPATTANTGSRPKR
jgi:citrate lyase beta subunit